MCTPTDNNRKGGAGEATSGRSNIAAKIKMFASGNKAAAADSSQQSPLQKGGLRRLPSRNSDFAPPMKPRQPSREFPTMATKTAMDSKPQPSPTASKFKLPKTPDMDKVMMLPQAALFSLHKRSGEKKAAASATRKAASERTHMRTSYIRRQSAPGNSIASKSERLPRQRSIAADPLEDSNDTEEKVSCELEPSSIDKVMMLPQAALYKVLKRSGDKIGQTSTRKPTSRRNSEEVKTPFMKMIRKQSSPGSSEAEKSERVPRHRSIPSDIPDLTKIMEDDDQATRELEASDMDKVMMLPQAALVKLHQRSEDKIGPTSPPSKPKPVSKASPTKSPRRKTRRQSCPEQVLVDTTERLPRQRSFLDLGSLDLSSSSNGDSDEEEMKMIFKPEATMHRRTLGAGATKEDEMEMMFKSESSMHRRTVGACPDKEKARRSSAPEKVDEGRRPFGNKPMGRRRSSDPFSKAPQREVRPVSKPLMPRQSSLPKPKEAATGLVNPWIAQLREDQRECHSERSRLFATSA